MTIRRILRAWRPARERRRERYEAWRTWYYASEHCWPGARVHHSEEGDRTP